MSLVRRGVFDPFADFWDPFDVFRAVVPAATSSDRDTAAFANARIDWKETPEAHVFKADIPGVKKEEVKVEVEDGNVLVISGERSKEKEDKNDKWHRVERSSGKFMRRFCLPENAKVECDAPCCHCQGNNTSLRIITWQSYSFPSNDPNQSDATEK
ncbi:hypothetical protein ACP70R_031214 [Stipagrostis hirtigluma subsp. patula]